MPDLLPLFLNLTGRPVLLVGAGRVAAGKLTQLLAAGARVRVVAPDISDELAAVVTRNGSVSTDGGDPGAVEVERRGFVESDLDGVWLVVAAATPDANREVASLAEPRRLFVNAVDDPPNATAYLSGVVRREGVTLAISTSGDAPALTSLLREGLDALLPRELASWIALARSERVVWRRDSVPMEARKPRLLRALNALYGAGAGLSDDDAIARLRHRDEVTAQDAAPAVPWLSGPEDSWL